MHIHGDTTSLKMLCRACDKTVELSADNRRAVKLFGNTYDKDAVKYAFYNSPYLRYDPSAPVDPSIPCPEECDDSKQKGNNTIYYKYDFENARFLFQCRHCGATKKST